MGQGPKNNQKLAAKQARQAQQSQRAEARAAKAIPATTKIDQKHHCEYCKGPIKPSCITAGHMFICKGIPAGFDCIDAMTHKKYEGAEWHCFGQKAGNNYVKRAIDFCVGCKEKAMADGRNNAAEKKAKEEQEAAERKEAELYEEWGIKPKKKKAKGKAEK